MRRRRKLIYVPIVHTEADMGSMLPFLQREYVKRGGPAAWRARRRSVDAMWHRIRRGILALGLDFRGVKIYQDGLPVCGREEEIVREVAGRGSLNHQLILELMERGARLVGTESPGLLLQEYDQLKEAGRMPKAGGPKGAEAPPGELLIRRDEFIARRIDETLGEGETGILFIGLLHDVAGRLPGDIKAHFLDKPPAPE